MTTFGYKIVIEGADDWPTVDIARAELRSNYGYWGCFSENWYLEMYECHANGTVTDIEFEDE